MTVPRTDLTAAVQTDGGRVDVSALLEQVHTSLVDTARQLADADDAAGVAGVGERLSNLITDVEHGLQRLERLEQERLAVRFAGGASGSREPNVAELAAALAQHLQENPALFANGRHAGRPVRRAARTRRSWLSSLLHVDVVLAAVALAIAATVLVAWMS